MKFKFDENLEGRPLEILRFAGHDVIGVVAQGLSGGSDKDIAVACRREKRCLVTLDHDSSNILLFPPQDYAGIIVLRPPKPKLSIISDLLKSLVPHLPEFPASGGLWIVEPGRIRVHRSD